MPRHNLNPYGGWPKVRQIRKEVKRVKGRVVPVMTWIVIHYLSRIILFWSLVWLLGAALVAPLLNMAQVLSQRNPFVIVVGSMVDFRVYLRLLLTEQYPQIGEYIYYTGLNQTDWHLLGAVCLGFLLHPVLSLIIARLTVIILYPLLSRQFKITVYRDVLIIHRLFRTMKVARHHNITVGVVNPEYQPRLLGCLLRYTRLQSTPLADFVMVGVYVDYRPIIIAKPRRMIDADRIVQSIKMVIQ